MGAIALSRFEAVAAFPTDSPIEASMMSLLDEGPGVGTAAGFLPPMNWREAMDLARHQCELLARRPILVVLQARVSRYRADALVLTRSRTARPGWHGDAAHGFFVECDGKEHHSSTVEQIRGDLAREREIYRETGLDTLRFSGAEINFRPNHVHQVLAARVEAMKALQEFGEEVRNLAQHVLRCVDRMSCHPALRTEYQARNRPAVRSLYDAADPTGAFYAAGGDIESDDFEALHDAVARLRHAVACCRLGGSAWEDDDEFPHRGFKPIGSLVASIVARV